MDDADAGSVLCAPFLARLPVAGVSITVVSRSGAQSTVGTSDAIAARLEELQFQLGEGPIRDVLRTGRPVLVPDLGSEGVRRDWPMFAAGAEEAGARALLSLPMAIGMTTVGVVSLYATATRSLWPQALVQTAAALTDSATAPAVGLATRSANTEGRPGRQQVELRREVHQAAGMVMGQLDSSVDEAMARLRAHAFVEDRSLEAVAREVVMGMLDFAEFDD